MLCEGQPDFDLVYARSGLPPSHNVVVKINLLACGEKAVCIYSQLKRCSSSEVAAMIEGRLTALHEMEVEKAIRG